MPADDNNENENNLKFIARSLLGFCFPLISSTYGFFKFIFSFCYLWYETGSIKNYFYYGISHNFNLSKIKIDKTARTASMSVLLGRIAAVTAGIICLCVFFGALTLPFAIPFVAPAYAAGAITAVHTAGWLAVTHSTFWISVAQLTLYTNLWTIATRTGLGFLGSLLDGGMKHRAGLFREKEVGVDQYTILYDRPEKDVKCARRPSGGPLHQRTASGRHVRARSADGELCISPEFLHLVKPDKPPERTILLTSNGFYKVYAPNNGVLGGKECNQITPPPQKPIENQTTAADESKKPLTPSEKQLVRKILEQTGELRAKNPRRAAARITITTIGEGFLGEASGEFTRRMMNCSCCFFHLRSKTITSPSKSIPPPTFSRARSSE